MGIGFKLWGYLALNNRYTNKNYYEIFEWKRLKCLLAILTAWWISWPVWSLYKFWYSQVPPALVSK